MPRRFAVKLHFAVVSDFARIPRPVPRVTLWIVVGLHVQATRYPIIPFGEEARNLRTSDLAVSHLRHEFNGIELRSGQNVRAQTELHEIRTAATPSENLS